MKYITIIKLLLILIVVSSSFLSKATQINNEERPLQPGEKVPDVTFTTVLNYKSKTAKLSDFKGKVILLDFWGTFCIPCVRNIPKLAEIQSKYKDNLVILSISFESEKTVQHFIDKKGDYTFPAIIGKPDAVILKYFPLTAVPHYVLIDQSMIFRYAATGEITKETIEKVIAGKQVVSLASTTVPEKKELMPNSDTVGVIYKSVLRRYDPRLSVGTVVYTKEPYKERRVTAKNAAIVLLYRDAYKTSPLDMLSFPFERVMLDVEYPEYLINEKSGTRLNFDQWIKKHGYNYDLIVPEDKKEQLLPIMRQELDRYFGFYSGLQKRKIKCLVLSSIAPDRLRTEGGTPLSDASTFWLTMKNQPMSVVIAALYRFGGIAHRLSVIDETNYKGNIDLDIKCTLSDIPVLSKELSKYGLKIEVAERELDVLVISDRHKDTIQ